MNDLARDDLAGDIARISKGWDDNPARAKSLHKEAYIDPRWFERDQQHIFRRSWQYLCHEEQLASAGDYMAASIGGLSVVVCRQRDGGL